MRGSGAEKFYKIESPIDDELWPKGQADSTSETPAEGVINEVVPESKYPIHESVFGPIGKDIEITDPLDHGNTTIERSEAVSFEASKDEGSWTGYGSPNVKDIREQRGEAILTTKLEKPDPPVVLDNEAGTNESEPINTESQDAGINPDQEPQTPEGSSSQSIENPLRQEEALAGSEKLGNIDMGATSAEAASRPERINNLGSILSSKGREFIQNMPENAKRVASSMYEGIYRIPGVNRVVAKAEIAWNQVWIDRKQDRIIELNDKVREITAETATLDESEAALNESLEIIRSQGFSGTAKIEKSLRKIASRKSELSEKKLVAESKVSRKQESMDSFVEKRNEITDRMVDKYGERMKPLETKLENLRGLQDALEFQTAIMEADHADKMIEIAKLDEKRTKVYNALRGAGQLDKNGNHPALNQFDSVINASKMRIAWAEATVKAKKKDIETRISETDAKANVYKGKQREFSAVKERGLYVSKAPEKAADRELEESELESGFAEEEHLAESSRLSIGTFLDKWNDHLKDTVSDEKRKISLTIDKAAFLKGARWNEGKELDYEHFVKVLDGYYRMKKVDFKDKTEMAEKFKGAKIDTK